MRGRTMLVTGRIGYNAGDPRGHGVCFGIDGRSWQYSGRSPMVRGVRLRLFIAVGVIPEGTGRMATWNSGQRSARADPRWRGAYRITRPILDTLSRTIPDGAGRTTSAWPTRTTRRDHPRWRGAYQQRCPIAFRRRGPSPMARGVRGTIRRCMRCRGTIPDGAGRTLHVMYVPDRLGDHPRWRGAYCWYWLRGRPVHGPSPVARGVPCSGDDVYSGAGEWNWTTGSPGLHLRTLPLDYPSTFRAWATIPVKRSASPTGGRAPIPR